MASSRSSQRWISPLALSLGALGVVYGDIGTSPLYALRECFHGPHAVAATIVNVYGVLSLIVWSLVVVISVKYVALILRADNEGEGGILALMALVADPAEKRNGAGQLALVFLGLFGAALLYGDGIITPAISVLSAIEGLEVAAPALDPYVVPITIGVLVGLFAIQRHGTAGIGFIFGPIMLVWFLVLAGTGLWQIVANPGVLVALNPWYAVTFFAANGGHGFLILGIVFLVVTGGEALYADMGHFGKRPIRLAWFSMVLPALLCNYFGQGALILRHPEWVVSPFYHLAADWAKYPLILLATTATVVASQAVISGAFSLTMQAVQLGYLPRLEIRHTSESEFGQIYIPLINTLLLLTTLALVVGFGSSSRLASAYGVAVTTTMVITTALAYFAMRKLWHWSMPLALATAGAFLVVDLSFFSANIVKVLDGGWFPLLVGLIVVTVMTTWRRGRAILARRIAETAVSYEEFFEQLDEDPPTRVLGTEIHMYSDPQRVPTTLLRNVRHNRVIHEQIAVVTIVVDRKPVVRSEHRIEVERPRKDFFLIRVHYGFLQTPNIPRALAQSKLEDLDLDPQTTTYILGRETLLATTRPGMALWRERLFAFLSRNALRATVYYRIPPKQVLEIGAQIEL
jgi:KUP system potassium uptake protein